MTTRPWLMDIRRKNLILAWVLALVALLAYLLAVLDVLRWLAGN